MGAAGTETLLHGTTSGSVDLYWDNSKKLETTKYGATVTGTLNADSATITSFQADSATIGEIQFQLGWADSHIGFREGALWYDPFHKNLNYYTDFDHPIEIGMQMIERVYNNTGVEIAKGKPLYYSGNYINDSGQESPLVALADATDAAKYNVQGLSAEAIPNASYGQIIVSGVVDKIDTSSLSAGDNFFLGLTPGAIQNAAPSYPNFPMCLGWVIISDPNNGKVIINQQNHSVPSFRVQADQHISGSLTIDGNLNVTGTQTISSTANVEIGGNFQYLNAGDTIGEAGTTFVGTGLDDAFFSGHYSGDSATKSFYVKIDGTGSPNTFEWGFDSAVGTEATGVAITASEQILDSAYGIEITFGATTGHTLGDKWTGTATATDIDTGFFSNRNDSAYTHVGLYFDVSENKWTFLNRYDPEPDAPIDPNSAGTQYGVVKATTFEGNLSGNVTGNVTGSLTGNASTATTLATGRNFSASGDATAPNVSFNGSAPVDLVLTLATVNSNVGSFGSSSAVPAITVNAKGLVTAVTATNIDHDALTNFVANEHIDHTSVSITAGTGLTGGGDITSTRDLAIDSAELNAYFGGSGKGFDADTLDGQEGTYYRINVYDAAGSLLN
jgi:cytoskeletal protein CcmA (bactofilin family)